MGAAKELNAQYPNFEMWGGRRRLSFFANRANGHEPKP